MKLSIMLILLLSACTTTKHVIIHVPIKVESPCVFEKFTEAEKSTMIEEVGRKIRRNQVTCFEKFKTIQKDIDAHNKLHEEK